MYQLLWDRGNIKEIILPLSHNSYMYCMKCIYKCANCYETEVTQNELYYLFPIMLVTFSV